MLEFLIIVTVVLCRRFIIESAETFQLEMFVPCYGGVHCVTLEMPKNFSILSNISVVAGHFFWNVWNALPSCGSQQLTMSSKKESAKELKTSVDPSFSCRPSRLVIGRHPVERAISYYYQRCYQLDTCIGYQRRINELSAVELEFIAVHERQAAYGEDHATLLVLDEGMSNAACRSLAGAKATSGMSFSGDAAVPLPPPLTIEDKRRALTHVRQCVVGLLERWESTLTVVGEWFPWLNLNVDRKRRKMFLYSGKESRSDLRPDLNEVLVRLNDCDMELYSEMERLFETQLSTLAEKKRYFM